MESNSLTQARKHLSQFEQLGETLKALVSLRDGLSLLSDLIEAGTPGEVEVCKNTVRTYEQKVISVVRPLLAEESSADESKLRYWLNVMKTFQEAGFGESEEFQP